MAPGVSGNRKEEREGNRRQRSEAAVDGRKAWVQEVGELRIRVHFEVKGGMSRGSVEW